VVRDGEEAVDFLFRRGRHGGAPRPDIILLDLNLPRKDGREVLAEIKEDPELKMIPVVVLTSSSAETDILRTYELHANCYVQKPVVFDRFADIVKQIDRYWFAVVSLPPKS
jgi:CheY-like chemotaxis protein